MTEKFGNVIYILAEIEQKIPRSKISQGRLYNVKNKEELNL